MNERIKEQKLFHSQSSILYYSVAGEPYHPLWSIEVLQKWVASRLGTKEQLIRYQADIEWYEHHRELLNQSRLE